MEVPVKVPYEVQKKVEVPVTVTKLVEVPVESKVIETHAVEMLKDVIKEIVREVTVPLRTRVEVIKEVQLTKTFVQDRLVVTKDRVEVPQPVTVLKEIPLYIERIIEVPVREERIQEKLVELTKQVPVEIVRQVSINVPKVVYIKEQVQVEHQVVHEVHVTTSTERIRNVEVIREIPVEMIREVPLTTYKETIREVLQKETIQIEKLVELQTTREVIKTVDVAKEVHHELVVEVPVLVEVEKPQNALLMRDLISQIHELNAYIDKLHLSTRTSLQRFHFQVKSLERVLAAERSVSFKLREAIEQMHNRPLHVTREVIKEVPVIHEVPVPLPPAATRAVVKDISDDTITETKFQLITMLANERALRLRLSPLACVSVSPTLFRLVEPDVLTWCTDVTQQHVGA